MSGQSEHGTMRSYVFGFILSLVFTLIPYYLVTSKLVSGGTLLPIILGVAIIQMIIQIVFFLHLGRGPKPMYNIVFFGMTVITILVVVTGSVWIIDHLDSSMASSDLYKTAVNQEGVYQINGEKTGACQQPLANHKVTIRKGIVTPIHFEAKLCDSLTFLEEDTNGRVITFGAHPRHESYAGMDEIPLHKGRGKTITLSDTGSYLFHDHEDPNVFGTFTVTK